MRSDVVNGHSSESLKYLKKFNFESTKKTYKMTQFLVIVFWFQYKLFQLIQNKSYTESILCDLCVISVQPSKISSNKVQESS